MSLTVSWLFIMVISWEFWVLTLHSDKKIKKLYTANLILLDIFYFKFLFIKVNKVQDKKLNSVLLWI